jgi:hypothetical protein
VNVAPATRYPPLPPGEGRGEGTDTADATFIVRGGASAMSVSQGERDVFHVKRQDLNRTLFTMASKSGNPRRMDSLSGIATPSKSPDY